MSVADETGTLHLLELPRHLQQTSPEKMDDLHQFIEEETKKKAERVKLQQMRDEQIAQPKLDKEEAVHETDLKKIQLLFTHNFTPTPTPTHTPRFPRSRRSARSPGRRRST